MALPTGRDVDLYYSVSDYILRVADEIEITSEDLPSMKKVELNILADIIHMLDEVRPVARKPEANKALKMSRTPRHLRELYETLLVMAGNMTPSKECF